jgi:UDP-GlcNAc3NAcA epimerase
MKLINIVGARPHFIKAATVSRVLKSHKSIKEIILHTGQHYDDNLSDVFFHELDIPIPRYNLGIGSSTHGQQTGRMMEAIEKILFKEKPDWVIVYGDTNSTLAGSLAAVKLHIQTAHIEAGLRSFNRVMPEEINRILVDHSADILFPPTKGAAINLIREGIDIENIIPVGDVMYDAALYYQKRAENRSNIINKLGLDANGFVLVTIHRAENTDNPERLAAIIDGLNRIAKKIDVVFPMHPRARKALGMISAKRSRINFLCLNPVGYLDMIVLEKNASLIATDSGGIQKEAFFFRIPCVTLRDETEWMELVELGWNRICSPTSGAVIFRAMSEMLGKAGKEAAPYGDGDASRRIVDCIIKRT